MNSRFFCLLAACLLASVSRAAWYDQYFSSTRAAIEPTLETPLRDAAIANGGDGYWYLTGTPGTGPSTDDFQNNDGVVVWRSVDLDSWESLGQVWTIETDAAPNSWQRDWRPNPDDAAAPLVRGMTSPELHFFEGAVWLTYSMNGQGTGLMTAPAASGPWVDLGRISVSGRDASIFVDDGTVYWVMDEGWIAPLNATRDGLLSEPVLLQPEPFAGAPGWVQDPRRVGRSGATLFKEDGRYYLVAADMWDRLGTGCWDTFIAWSDQLYGPYSPRYLMIPHGGQVTVFDGPGDVLCASFAPRDLRAVFQDRPAWLQLEWRGGVLYGDSTDPFPRKPPSVVTEFGPWDRLTPALDLQIRDLQLTYADDGFYYLTGSGVDPAFSGKVMLLKSADLQTWEVVDVQFDYFSIPGTDEAMRQRRFDGRNEGDLTQYFMDSEVYRVDGHFYIFTSLYNSGTLEEGDFAGSFIMRSTGTTPEGPYVYHLPSRSQGSFFEDTDGTRYIVFNGKLQAFLPDMSDFTGPVINLSTETGTNFTKGDVATNLALIEGKYVMFATGWSGGNHDENFRAQDSTYDWYFWVSDSLSGPYRMPRNSHPLPHSGHSCQLIQGHDNRWYGCFFGNDSSSPWWNRPGILVYDVRLDSGVLRIDLKDELP